INAQSSKVITLQSSSVHFSSAATAQFSSADDIPRRSQADPQADAGRVRREECPRRQEQPEQGEGNDTTWWMSSLPDGSSEIRWMVRIDPVEP
ncbi:hypothetical protein, partial [Sinomonas atrocyanea]|uniref:hypothetical protein n=1 Tax=Sinomonas atrocyanea TaxID=37927 RepID=UPI0027D7C6E0